MKFNRQHLEELTLQKIKEVNDEAGYRSYLEVPEMVNIIATIMEDRFRVEHDDLVRNIQLLYKELDNAQIKAENLETELEEYRSIAEKVGAEKAISDKAKWEELADKLIAYAEEVKCETACQALLEAACQDIEEYRKLKEKTDGTI